RRLALLQTGPAQEVVRHLGARGRSVPAHERLEDPLVLVDAARMRALPFARADRVERQRAAEGLRETLDRAVVRGLGQQRVELPRELSGVGAVAERRARTVAEVDQPREVVRRRAGASERDRAELDDEPRLD